MEKLIAIVGPTASGKSSLAIKLAQELGGEIISADSRQIYRGLEIGSDAVTRAQRQGVRHHLLSFKNPRTVLGADQFKRLAERKIDEVLQRRKLPFLVGGTGFYVKAVTENLSFPKARPNPTLRQRLGKKSLAELFRLLKKLDPERAKSIDRNNPRRLIRALEIAYLRFACASKKQVSLAPSKNQISQQPRYDCLVLGIKRDKTVLRQKIEGRFRAWLRQGFLQEVERLRRTKLTQARFKELGLHYWYAYLYLTKQLAYEEFCRRSVRAIWHYAKRQLTWFKREQKIVWIENYRQAKAEIKKFLATKSS